MIILDRSVIIQVPKTGSTFIMRVLGHMDIKYKIAPHHETTWHGGIDDGLKYIGNRKIIGFIRHPETWLRSLWSYWTNWEQRTPGYLRKKIEGGEDFAGMIDLLPCTFEKFVMESEWRQPGWVTRQTLGRLQGRTRSADFIGRQERLVPDLQRALALTGLRVGPEVWNVPKANVVGSRPCWAKRCIFTTVMSRLVSESEARLLKYYGGSKYADF